MHIQPSVVSKEHNFRILTVDDDPDIQTTIELRMRDYNVSVEHAYFGMQGVTESLQSKPDLILLDMAMPNGNGEYFLNCIKANPMSQDIPVVILTGMRDPKIKRQMLALGASAFLNKPVLFEDLVATLQQFIDIVRRESTEVSEYAC